MTTHLSEKVRIPAEPVVPRVFSGLSRAEQVRTHETRSGVVFGSLEELEAALRRFEIGEKAKVGNIHAQRDIGNVSDPNAGIIDRVREFETIPERYSLFGTSFNWTETNNSHISIVRVDGTYVMHLNIPGIESSIEQEIAEGTGAHLALTGSTVIVDYLPVDLLWFNIDLVQYAKILGTNQKDMDELAIQFFHSPDSKMELETGNVFGVRSFRISVETTSIHYGFDREHPRYLAGSEGTRIFGASAWHSWNSDYSERAEYGFTFPSTSHLGMDLRLPRNFPEGSGKRDRPGEYTTDSVPRQERIDEVYDRRDALVEKVKEVLLREQ